MDFWTLHSYAWPEYHEKWNNNTCFGVRTRFNATFKIIYLCPWNISYIARASSIEYLLKNLLISNCSTDIENEEIIRIYTNWICDYPTILICNIQHTYWCFGCPNESSSHHLPWTNQRLKIIFINQLKPYIHRSIGFPWLGHLFISFRLCIIRFTYVIIFLDSFLFF